MPDLLAPTPEEVQRRQRNSLLQQTLALTEPDPAQAAMQTRQAGGEQFMEGPPSLAQQAARWYQRGAETAGPIAKSLVEPDPDNPAGSMAVVPSAVKALRAPLLQRYLRMGEQEADPLQKLISDRDVWYHATSPQNVPNILQSGEIRPMGRAKSAEEALLTQGLPVGVSVSRVPRVASKADKAVTFAIDRSKMPPSRPFAEAGYGKTLQRDLYEPTPEGIYQKMGQDVMPNPHFEFEQRTYNQPIPLSAVREALIDADAFKGGLGGWTPEETIGPELARAGIPMRTVPSGRALHAERAARGKRFYSRPNEAPTE